MAQSGLGRRRERRRRRLVAFLLLLLQPLRFRYLSLISTYPAVHPAPHRVTWTSEALFRPTYQIQKPESSNYLLTGLLEKRHLSFLPRVRLARLPWWLSHTPLHTLVEALWPQKATQHVYQVRTFQKQHVSNPVVSANTLTVG